MADKKNIVIKVKYPTPGKLSEKKVSAPVTVTEWNVKRIAISLAGLGVALAMLFYFLNKDDPATEPDKPLAVSTEINANPSKPLQQEAKNHVLRSVLTYKIENNEPADEIKAPIKTSKKASTWIYYFVELKDMKGKTVYHEWLLDGVLVSRKKVHISDETWRTSSRQVFTYTSENNWTVRLVDEAGTIINEKQFDVIYE